MYRHAIALPIVLILIDAATAHAGRTHFGWSYGTDVVPERGTELETWILEENKKGDDKVDQTSFWWGVVFALTPHVELAITTEAKYEKSLVEEGDVHFHRWGGEIRYRPQSPDSIDAGPFATLFRVGAKRLIEDRAGIRGEADIVASYSEGRVFAAIDAGAVYVNSPLETELVLRPGAGLRIREIVDLGFGIEAYAEIAAHGNGTTWMVVGPTISLTHGRFWGAATYGVGLFGIRGAPRLTFGVAL
jgi:hypothetical protein